MGQYSPFGQDFKKEILMHKTLGTKHMAWFSELLSSQQLSSNQEWWMFRTCENEATDLDT